MLLLYIVLFLLLASFALAAASLAPWVPAWKKDLSRIMALAQLKPGDVFYDLGCGDGRVVLYAAKHFPVQAIGVELALPMIAVCWARKLFSRRKNLHFHWRNLFAEDLSTADVVYVYGLPEKLGGKLKKKLERELQPGSRVITMAFPIKGWKEDIRDKPNPKTIAIYRYLMPKTKETPHLVSDT